MAIKFTDNALTKLAAPITNSSTTLSVVPSTGDRFPVLNPGGVDYCVLTMEDAAGNREFIRVDFRASGSDTFGNVSYPLQRGYWGSTARAWNTGDSVDIRMSANVLNLMTAPGSDPSYNWRSNNLSDVANVATARANLGVSATGADTSYNLRANNLNDVGNVATARANLGVPAIVNNLSEYTATAAAARGGINAAAAGANSDITSLNGPALGAATATTQATGDNSTKVATTAFVQTVAPRVGQCQLQYVSLTQIKLMPKGGNALVVNGAACTIPDGGVTADNTGLTANTLYYVYATASAGVVNGLVFSTTAHATSTAAGNKGVEIMSGDETKSLVGMVYADATAKFNDNNTTRTVRSWFNDVGVMGMVVLGANTTLANAGTYAPLLSAYVLLWAREQVMVAGNMSATEGSGLAQAHVSAVMNNGLFVGVQSYAVATAGAASNTSPRAVTSLNSDGLATLQLAAITSTGYYSYAQLAYTGIAYSTAGR